ncbi:MAG: hypothetical protein A2231_06745 [Candidatus Firestonebacteria bacterium RIFOXYA2_FULL_40_8]|nr:MAG: hypothetical protein A2231_06745 [Candidatus Firestonebacteria bacterium RIFOXYA2_FULL_40_8]
MAVKNVKNLELEKRKLEFKKIKAEIDKVAQVQKFLVVVIRFSVTILMALLLFVFFMALNYAMPISAKVSQFMLYGILGYFVISLLSYVIKPLFNKPDDEALALMIEKRYPQLLDRFICSVEMNKEEAVANFSPGLIKALWVDTDKVKKALKLDLRKALAFTKGKQYIGIALGLTVVAFVGSIVAPEFLLKSTSGIAPVNRFVSSLLRGNTLDPDILKQGKALDQQLKDRQKMIEELRNVLADQKKFNNDLKDAIQDKKVDDQKRAEELAQKDPELANKPWLPGRDPQFKNPNVGGVSGIVTSNGKPMAGIYVAVKSVTDKKANGVGAKTDKNGVWVINNLNTDGSYQCWVLNMQYKSQPLSYFSGVVVEKGRVRTGYDFALKKKQLAEAAPDDGSPQAPQSQKPEDIFNDSDTYEEQKDGPKKGGAAEDKMFPKMDFDKLEKPEDAAKEAEKNKIILPEDEKTKDLPKENKPEEKKEEKLQEMAKELEKQDQKKDEKQDPEKKEVSEKLKDIAEKMEEMKKDENKKDEKEKDKERKEMEKKMEETAKKLEEMNKEEKDEKQKEVNEEMAKELKRMNEEMKKEDELKKQQEDLEKKTDEMAKKEQMKDAKDEAEKAKEKQDDAEKELQKSEMEKALEKALEAEKKLEESLQKLMEEQKEMADKKNKEDEMAKKDEEKKDEEKKDGEKKDEEKKDEKTDAEKKAEEKALDDLKKEMEDAAKKDQIDEKKLEELMKEMEEAQKKMEELDKQKAEEMKKKIEEVKKDMKDEKKMKSNAGELQKKIESLAGLLGELKNKAFLAQKHGTDEDPVANMTKDEVPSKYKKLVDKYRTSLSK